MHILPLDYLAALLGFAGLCGSLGLVVRAMLAQGTAKRAGVLAPRATTGGLLAVRAL